MRIGHPVANVSSRITVDADIDMNSQKLTELAAGSASGHSVRYEQVVGVYLPLAGGTMTGDLGIGANKLKTTALYIQEYASTRFLHRRTSDDADMDIQAAAMLFTSRVQPVGNAKIIATPDTNANYLVGQARDTDVGLVEIWRMVGAADPYFQASLPMVDKPQAPVATLVEGHRGYDSTDDMQWFEDASRLNLQPLRMAKKTINFDDSSPVTVFTIPAGGIVIGVKVNVRTGFAGTSPTLDIGDGDDTDGFLPTTQVAPTVTGWKGSSQGVGGAYLFDATTYKHSPKLFTSATAIIVTIGGTSLSAGIADVYIIWY